jgi:hypothetical protein
MRAVLRGKIYKPTHEKAGFTDEVAPIVGTDESKEIANKSSGLQHEQIQVTERFPVAIVKFIIQKG